MSSRLPYSFSFNPNDPFEDTESPNNPTDATAPSGFNPNDPFEDTESSSLR